MKFEPIFYNRHFVGVSSSLIAYLSMVDFLRLFLFVNQSLHFLLVLFNVSIRLFVWIHQFTCLSSHSRVYLWKLHCHHYFTTPYRSVSIHSIVCLMIIENNLFQFLSVMFPGMLIPNGITSKDNYQLLIVIMDLFIR